MEAWFRSVRSSLLTFISPRTIQLPGAEEALRINPIRYSLDAFVEDGVAYINDATALLGYLHTNAYLQHNCEVDYCTNENHPLTPQKYTGLRLA